MIDFEKVPFHPSEIRWVDEREFRLKQVLFQDSLDDGSEGDYYHLAEAISHIIDCDENYLYEEVPHKVHGDEDLVDFIFSDNDEVSLIRLYRHIITVINSYEEPFGTDAFEVFYKGDYYKIGQNSYLAAMNLEVDLTTAEAVEVMHLKSQFKKVQDKLKEEDESITTADLVKSDYKIGLSELAILLKKDGDKLPHFKKSRNDYIKERAEYFKDISYQSVLDVRFFLTNTINDYVKKTFTGPFGKEDQAQQENTTQNSKLTFKGSRK